MRSGGSTEWLLTGRPGYLSPEQIKGENAHGRSDLFAVGGVLFDLVARRRPFDGETLVSVLTKTLDEEPDMSLIPAGKPWDRLREVIARALQKSPEARYPDARTMRADLEVALRELGDKAD